MIEDFFVTPVTIVKPTVVQDNRGDSVRSWDDPTRIETKCWVAPSSSGQPIAPGRVLVVATGDVLRFPADTDIDAEDRLDLDGLTWTVDGRPSPAHTPNEGTHHLRVQIKAVEG